MTVVLVFFCRMQIWFFQNPVLSGLVDFLLLFLFLYIVQRSTHQLVMAISADPKKQIGNRIGFGSKSVPIPIRPRISRYIYLSFILGYGLGFISCIHLPKKVFFLCFPLARSHAQQQLSLSLEIHRPLVATGLCTTGLPSPPIVGMYHAIISPSSYISVLFLIPVDLNRRPTFSIQQQQTVCSIGRT